MAPLAGFNARATINGQAYSVAEWSIDSQSEALDITNSEGVAGGSNAEVGEIPGSFQTRTGGPSVCRITLKNASFDLNESPFGSPLDLRERDFIAIVITPDAEQSVGHTFPSAQITNLRHEGSVRGLQPVTIEAESDGSYTLGQP